MCPENLLEICWAGFVDTLTEGISKLASSNLPSTIRSNKPITPDSFTLMILALYRCFYLLTESSSHMWSDCDHTVQLLFPPVS